MSEYIDAVTAALKFGLDKGTGPARLDRESVRALINEIERLRARDEQHYRSVKQAWQAIPDEFKLSPTDGGGIDEHFAIADMAKEIERLRAHVEALQQKIDADKSCACAYDSPDDVCLPHSPVVAELKAENDRLRAALARSDQPCAYCSLPAAEWAKCASGFPGCSRADDAMGCPELGAAMERDQLRSNLTEALQLMEPVAEAEESMHWPHVVTVLRDDARAIADFVKRMKGESNE